MKQLFFSILFLNSFLFFSQTNQKLYYYVESDSMLGVKNQNGKIVIPAQPSWVTDRYYNNPEIKERLVYLCFKSNPFSYYDRNGHFLFTPFPTGEGPDDFQEGFIRFMENKKVGLYSVQGERIIPAKYDWLSAINFGFAEFCNGCYFDYSTNPEHAPLVGGTWGFVNREGKEIQPADKRNHLKDFEISTNKFR